MRTADEGRGGVIRYRDVTGARDIVFEADVVRHFERCQQRTARRREAGGQLFARFADRDTVRIGRATGPRWSDRRGRTFFLPNRWAERREIHRLFRSGEHFVGDWHTHPEERPVPSDTDIVSVQEMFRQSSHALGAFVMVIVGTGDLPAGLLVALVNADSIHELRVVCDTGEPADAVVVRSRPCARDTSPS